MQPSGLFQRYRELQQYVHWTDEDAQRVRRLAPAAQRHFAEVVDDFYSAIQQNPATMKVIIGGAEQLERLKGTLTTWLIDLFSGKYDEDYVVRRWKVGLRHVEIGLDQVYTNAALSRLRGGLLLFLEKESAAGNLPGSACDAMAARRSLNKLLDLDLAIIEDAYQAEFLARQNRTERGLQNERLAAIGEAMTGLVHESRNALQRSQACLEMLAVEIADRPSALNLVERIQNAQNDLQQLFEEVRQYAAPIQLQLKKCNVADIWRQAWQDLSSLHEEKKLGLQQTTQGMNLESTVDPFALRQALRNILENAIHAAPKNSRVEIACSPASIDGQDGLQITISDQGPGIPVELRSRVLEPFFTTKTKGTGLGLAIAQRIAQSHGGQLSVLDSRCPGAQILICLPRELS
jgi:signal transduction histidine kinase